MVVIDQVDAHLAVAECIGILLDDPPEDVDKLGPFGDDGATVREQLELPGPAV